MDTQTKARFTKDKANKKITVVKDIDADINTVWTAFTDSKQLDKWWAPKPWRAETKEMNFKEGGRWLYAMVGPKGERHWRSRQYVVFSIQISQKSKYQHDILTFDF